MKKTTLLLVCTFVYSSFTLATTKLGVYVKVDDIELHTILICEGNEVAVYEDKALRLEISSADVPLKNTKRCTALDCKVFKYNQAGEPVLISNPFMIVEWGKKGTITLGSEKDGVQEDSFRLDITPTQE